LYVEQLERKNFRTPYDATRDLDRYITFACC